MVDITKRFQFEMLGMVYTPYLNTLTGASKHKCMVATTTTSQIMFKIQLRWKTFQPLFLHFYSIFPSYVDYCSHTVIPPNCANFRFNFSHSFIAVIWKVYNIDVTMMSTTVSHWNPLSMCMSWKVCWIFEIKFNQNYILRMPLIT